MNQRAYGNELSEALPRVRITPEMLARVEARAVADDTYVSDLVRTAVQEWLDAPQFVETDTLPTRGESSEPAWVASLDTCVNGGLRSELHRPGCPGFGATCDLT